MAEPACVRSIVVAPAADGFSVVVEPPAADIPLRQWPDHSLALAQARLIRLEHGWKIDDRTGKR